MLFNANSANCQLYHGENKLIFNEMMMRSTLYYVLSWIFILLAHWNNSPRIDMSPYSNTLARFRAKQSLLFLLNATCKQQIPILYIVFGLTRSGLEPTIYHTRGKHVTHYTTNVVIESIAIKIITKFLYPCIIIPLLEIIVHYKWQLKQSI